MPDRLTQSEITAAAVANSIERAALIAVIEVESGGSGFLADGRPKILLEGHYLWKQLKARGIDPKRIAASKPSLCFPSWTRKWYRCGAAEWARVQQVLDWASANAPTQFESYKKAAYESCSWGLFQLMGANYEAAGFDNVYQFAEAHRASEAKQLEAILTWMRGNGLLAKLRAKDWSGFARGYNGPGQVAVYSAKLRREYEEAAR